MPLKYLYVGKIPLHEAITNAESLGERKIDFGPCDTYLFRDVLWSVKRQDLVYYLDRETALPVRVDSAPTGPKGGKPAWSWVADRIETIQGYPIVTHSRLLTFLPGTQGDVVLSVTNSEVESIRFDAPVSEEMFRVEPSPGIVVEDTIAGRRIVTPGTAPPPATPLARKAATAVATPVRAEPPGNGYPAAWAVSGVGVALLVGAFVLSRRR